MGFFDSNSSSSSTNYTSSASDSNNVDNYAERGAVSLNTVGDVSLSMVDGGAFDLVKASDAQAGKNYNSLLSGTGKLFDLGAKNYSNLLNTTSGLFTGLLGGVQSSQSLLKETIDVQQSKGTLDNKTIMIVGLAIAGVIGLAILKGRK